LNGGSAGGLEGKTATRTVSLEGCSVAQRSKHAFDPSNPAGAYIMNCDSEYGQGVLLSVVEMVSALQARPSIDEQLARISSFCFPVFIF